jgi:hypothetical protein
MFFMLSPKFVALLPSVTHNNSMTQVPKTGSVLTQIKFMESALSGRKALNGGLTRLPTQGCVLRWQPKFPVFLAWQKLSVSGA